MLRNSLIAGCIFLMMLATARPGDSASPGFLEGHLSIVALKEVERDDAAPSKDPADDYAAHPLLILSKDGKKQIRQVIADKAGNYRVSLPPGDYVLDAKGRAPKRVRAKPKAFTVVSNQAVHVDFELDTGIR